MTEEKVERRGRIVKVTLGGISCEKLYSRDWHAKQAEYRLLMSKKAREDFFRPKRRR